MAQSNRDKVEDFHRKFDIPIGKLGHIPPLEESMLRIRLMLEELGELVTAMEQGDYVEVADGIGDLLYTVEGAAVCWGIPSESVFDEIHKSNMTKDPARTPGGKVTKGSDFVPPDLERILNESR